MNNCGVVVLVVFYSFQSAQLNSSSTRFSTANDSIRQHHQEWYKKIPLGAGKLGKLLRFQPIPTFNLFGILFNLLREWLMIKLPTATRR